MSKRTGMPKLAGRCRRSGQQTAARWLGRLTLVVLLGSATTQSFTNVDSGTRVSDKVEVEAHHPQHSGDSSSRRHLLELSSAETGCDQFRDKGLEWLDRHDITCGTDNKFIRRFKSSNSGCGGGDNQQFSISCRSTVFGYDADTCSNHDTGSNEIADKDIVYLDRHDISCPTGKALQRWRLGGNKIDYRCCNMPPGTSTDSCVARNTGCTGQGKLQYLDRHNVECTGANEVMTRWKLVGCGGGNVKIDFTCCPLPTVAPPPPSPPPPSEQCAKCAACTAEYGYNNVCA